MDQHRDDLWQGGAWEQPAPTVAPLSGIALPKPPKKRRSRRRPAVVFALLLSLIGGLTAGTLIWRSGQSDGQGVGQNPDTGSPAGAVQQPPAVSQPTRSEGLSLPQAPTGTGVTVPISPLPEQVLSYAQVYEKNQQSIVAVHVMDRTSMGQGTGIVLTEDGYIITNAHIVDGAGLAVVTLNNNMEYDASLVGMSLEEDLAVLKIQAQGLIPAEFGDSDLLRVGDEVSAVGNPLGYRMTMTPGIVSALDREVELDGSTLHLIQTSAAINVGNSGGALFNDRGQVVGVTTVKVVGGDGSVEGLGFAIPSRRVKYVVDQLIAGESIRTPVLGITVQYDPAVEGLMVLEVQDWSDAAAKGMQVGDVIVSVEGNTVREFRDLERVKDLKKVGEELLVQIARGGELLELRICLEDSQLRYGPEP